MYGTNMPMYTDTMPNIHQKRFQAEVKQILGTAGVDRDE